MTAEPPVEGRGMADDFERELQTDIAQAEAFGEDELAAEWRLELNSYRAARRLAAAEGSASGGSDAGARGAALRERLSEP